MTDFLTADTNLPSYMMFPRFLLDMEINETAKMLYIILLDRARLSQKNEGWSDIDGHVFIYFTIEALAEVLHKSQMTVKTALAVLEKQELIFRKRQGPGQPNRIYVKLPKETIHYTDRFLSLRQTENCPIDRPDSFPDTDRKLSGNKKEIKKNNLEKRGSKEPLSPYGKFQNVFLSEKELEDIHAVCEEYHIPLYMDGARLGYGLAAEGTDVTLPVIAKCCDAFYIGGTKVGALCGEAVVFPDKKTVPKHFFTIIKQHGALLAKRRILGIQFETLFTDDLYMEISRHAISMANLLKKGLKEKGYGFFLDSPTNQQFVILDNKKLEELRKEVTFSVWEKADDTHTVVRFATSWATKEEDIRALLALL